MIKDLYIEYLRYKSQMLFQQGINVWAMIWFQSEGSMNNGQLTLNMYLQENVRQLYEDWVSDWPWVQAYDVADTAFGTHEAVEYALDFLVYTGVEMWQNYIDRAQALEDRADWLESLIFI